MRKMLCAMLAAMLLVLAACGGFRAGKKVEVYGYREDTALAQRIGAVYGIRTDDAEELASEQAVLTAVSKDKYGLGYLAALAPDETVKTVPVTDASQMPIYVARKQDLASDTMAVDFYHFLLNVIGQQVAQEQGYTGLVEMPLAMCSLCIKPAGELTMMVQPGLEPLAQALRDRYYGYNKEAEITILTEGDVWQSAQDGTCTIAMGYGQPQLDDTMEIDLLGEPNFTIIAHPENPIQSISAAQLAKVLAGEDVQWSAVIA